MYKNSYLIAVGICVFIASPANATDARSLGLGGSSIANGVGVSGALENPSSLMQMQRDQHVFHIHLGASTDIQDNGDYIATANDETALPDNIENEIEALKDKDLTCNITSSLETVCLQGTAKLAELSARALEIMAQVDQEPLDATVGANFGISYTKWAVPIAVHFKTTATGSATTAIASEDFDYVGIFADVLADDELTLEELITSVPLTISNSGQNLAVQQPEDVLLSTAQASSLVRIQLGLSMATTVTLSGFDVDLGVTPKFSELTAASLTTNISDNFDDDADSLEDQYLANENIATSWTIDVGATTKLKNKPITLSMVARNLIKESITTNENFAFDTTPQLIVGGTYQLGKVTVSADTALNTAKVDNMETQIMAVGVEVSNRIFAARAGISHDNARTKAATALSLGLSIGPLHIGGRLTDLRTAQAAAQLAYSF